MSTLIQPFSCPTPFIVYIVNNSYPQNNVLLNVVPWILIQFSTGEMSTLLNFIHHFTQIMIFIYFLICKFPTTLGDTELWED